MDFCPIVQPDAPAHEDLDDNSIHAPFHDKSLPQGIDNHTGGVRWSYTIHGHWHASCMRARPCILEHANRPPGVQLARSSMVCQCWPPNYERFCHRHPTYALASQVADPSQTEDLSDDDLCPWFIVRYPRWLSRRVGTLLT